MVYTLTVLGSYILTECKLRALPLGKSQDSERLAFELSHIAHHLEDRGDVKSVGLTEHRLQETHQTVDLGVQHERSIVLLAIESLEKAHDCL